MRRDNALLHAKTGTFRSALRRAQDHIARALQTTDAWYVAMSGGKDATCVLSLVREQAPDVDAVAFVQKWMLPETVAYLQRVPGLATVAADDTIDREYADERWRDEAEARAVWPRVTWLGEQVIPADISYGRWETGCFLGLRAEESRVRRLNLRTRGSLYWAETTRMWHCCPIGHWSAMDVWAYIESQGLDYNRAYDVMEAIGVPLERQRIAELMIDRVLGYGTLAVLKRGWPAFLNEFLATHPEARSYV